MLHCFKKYIKTFVGLFGIEIRRKEQIAAYQVPRALMYGCLQQAVKNGLSPETVLDVGAAYGTRDLYEIFPEAYHILIEPLQEFEPHLLQVVKHLKKAEYILAGATSTPGNIPINVHPDLVGSSIYREEEDSDVNGFERIVPAITLDEICRDRGTTVRGTALSTNWITSYLSSPKG